MAGYLTHFGLAEAKTPFIKASPRYTNEQFAEFLASIKEHGVEEPILVDEVGNILDGHTRQKAEPDCPFRIVDGLESDDHKFAFAYRKNHERLHQTPKQLRKHREILKPVVLRLLEHHTQSEVSKLTGVAQATISGWKTDAGMAVKDNRKKLSPAQVEEIKERAANGETQQAIADSLGVAQGRVAQIISIIGADNANNSVKKTDPISARAQAAKAAVATGAAAAETASRFGFSNAVEYRAAAIVAESGNEELIAAMDQGVLSPDAARSLSKASPEKVTEKLREVKAKQSLKALKTRGCVGKSRPDLLQSAIHNAYMLLSTYASDGIDARDIPRSQAKREKLNDLIDSLEKITTVLFADIRRRLK